MRWNEENIKEWLNNNDLNGFKFIKINELKNILENNGISIRKVKKND
ncbi:MAG: hypothetical protein RR246_06985 [Clostridia bacterium]